MGRAGGIGFDIAGSHIAGSVDIAARKTKYGKYHDQRNNEKRSSFHAGISFHYVILSAPAGSLISSSEESSTDYTCVVAQLGDNDLGILG